jgi:hypothetical protein
VPVEVELKDPKAGRSPGDTVEGVVRVKTSAPPAESRLTILCGWRLSRKGWEKPSRVYTPDEFGPESGKGTGRPPLRYEVGRVLKGTPADSVLEERFSFDIPPGPFSYAGKSFSADWVVCAEAGDEEAAAEFKVGAAGFHGVHQGASASEMPQGVDTRVLEGISLAGTCVIAGLSLAMAAGLGWFGYRLVRLGLRALGSTPAALEDILLPTVGLPLCVVLLGLALFYAGRAVARYRRAGRVAAKMRFPSRFVVRGGRLDCSLSMVPAVPMPDASVAAALSCVEVVDAPSSESAAEETSLGAVCDRRPLGDLSVGVERCVEFSLAVAPDAALSAWYGEASVEWRLNLKVESGGRVFLEEAFPVVVYP